jgi:hypothetical protein
VLHLVPHLHVCCDEPGCSEILESASGNVGPFHAILRARGWRLRGTATAVNYPPETMVWRWFCPRHAMELHDG